MIIFFNNQPVTENTKIAKAFARAEALYGSDYFNLENETWFGDKLTVESLIPTWIMQEYKSDPQEVLLIPILKNYLRWLFSLEYGYGAQLDWENLRTGLLTNSVFLEAWANFYFPNADFGSSPLKEKLPNIRKFSINSDLNYFNGKGTSSAIKYAICTLFDFNLEEINVTTSNSCILEIDVLSSKESDLKNYRPFIEEYLVPAGVSVVYGVM